MIQRRAMIVLLTITPLLALLSPRALAWWPAVLGLAALMARDPQKTPDWITACLPLWAGLLSLVSVIWAAFPYDALMLSVDRLPLLYGLSLALLGLSALRDDIWQNGLRCAASGFVACVCLSFAEQVMDNPFHHFLYRLGGEENIRLTWPSAMNRTWTALLLLAMPCLWTLWRMERPKLTIATGAALLAGLALSIASAALLAGAVGLAVWIAALWRPRWVRNCLILGGLAALFATPWLLPFLFTHRPEAAFIHSPSTGGRLEIWDSLARAVQLRPVTGYGYEATRFYQLDTQQLYLKEATVLHPHNAFLQIWMEFGVIGAALAALALGHVMRPMRSAGALALCSIILVIGLLSFGLWQGAWLGLIVVSACYGRAAATVFGNRTQ